LLRLTSIIPILVGLISPSLASWSEFTAQMSEKSLALPGNVPAEGDPGEDRWAGPGVVRSADAAS
jgi:hypothetical protein